MADEASIRPMRFAISLIVFLGVVAGIEWGPSLLPVLMLRDSPSSAKHLGETLVPAADSCHSTWWSVTGVDRPFNQSRNAPSCLFHASKKGLWAIIDVYPGLNSEQQGATTHTPPVGMFGDGTRSKSGLFEGCISKAGARRSTTSEGGSTTRWWARSTVDGLLVQCGELRQTGTGGTQSVAATLRVVDLRSGTVVDASVGRDLWDNSKAVLPSSGAARRQLDARGGRLLNASEWKQLWVVARAVTERVDTLSQHDLLSSSGH